MNPIAKKLWLEALRSGKYHKGKSGLKKIVNGRAYHCCLGVLCEIAIKEGIPLEETKEASGPFVNFSGESAVLPFQVRDWAKLDYDPETPIEDKYGMHSTLAGLNDSMRYSFKKIADVIEEYL